MIDEVQEILVIAFNLKKLKYLQDTFDQLTRQSIFPFLVDLISMIPRNKRCNFRICLLCRQYRTDQVVEIFDSLLNLVGIVLNNEI